MPYIISLVIIIVAAGAILLFKQPTSAPEENSIPEGAVPAPYLEPGTIPEGFNLPTSPPPGSELPEDESVNTTQ